MKYSGRNNIHNNTRTTNQQQTQCQKEITQDDFDGIKLNSKVLVRKRTIPTKRPPLVGEDNANFKG
jgi:hypothetical protein